MSVDYTLHSHIEDKEIQRLDELHNSITRYLGGRLSMAPLESSSPTSILEIGSGSGAWAIKAAREFENAQVTAVDLKPLPNRQQLPSNLKFQCINLATEFPFEPSSFDIVHARLVMMHIPHGMKLLERIAECIKPGGWLIIEEPDDDCFLDEGKSPGPNLTALIHEWHSSMREKGAEPCFGRFIEPELRALGCFAEVNVHYIDIPLSCQSSDSAQNQLGIDWVRNIERVTKVLLESLRSRNNISKDLMSKALEELKDPNKRLSTRMHFTWSRKA